MSVSMGNRYFTVGRAGRGGLCQKTTTSTSLENPNNPKKTVTQKVWKDTIWVSYYENFELLNPYISYLKKQQKTVEPHQTK